MQQCDKRQDEFTSRDVEIISKESVFEGFFKMVKYRFKHKLFAGGWSDVVEREMFERGHAAAMLPYDPKTDQVVII
ncbi:ADP-ribose diphosphatase, partial [Vibrio parahaemolyticus]